MGRKGSKKRKKSTEIGRRVESLRNSLSASVAVFDYLTMLSVSELVSEVSCARDLFGRGDGDLMHVPCAYGSGMEYAVCPSNYSSAGAEVLRRKLAGL
jgi:hypothetical protein